MQHLHEVNAVEKKKEKFFPPKKTEEKKKSANGSTQQIDCKFCGRKHVPDRSKCPAYGQKCKMYVYLIGHSPLGLFRTNVNK